MTFLRRAAALSVALCLFCISARAQLILGGGFGLGSNGETITVNVSPEIGYRILPEFCVGTLLSYRFPPHRFGVDPYMRWNFVSLGERVSIFAEATAPLSWAKDYACYSVRLRPGLTIGLNENCSLYLHLGSFGWQSITRQGNTEAKWSAMVNGDTVSVGFGFAL